MVATTNLISYWKFDENAANTTVADAHGSNDGTASVNTSTLYDASGKIESCFDFPNNATNVAIGPMATFTAYTVNLWCKPDGLSAYENLIAIRANNHFEISRDTWEGYTGHWKVIHFETGNVYNRAIANDVISNDTWQMVTATWDGSTVKLYINAVLQTITATNVTSMQDKNDSDQISKHNYDGLIDEVAIFSVDIGSTGVSDLYNSGDGLAYPFTSTGWAGKIQNISPGKVQNSAKADISKIQGVE